MDFHVLVFGSSARTFREGCLELNLFSDIDELLLRMYYMYKKSFKKCHELEDIVIELKACLEPSQTSGGGIRPLRACGTRS